MFHSLAQRVRWLIILALTVNGNFQEGIADEPNLGRQAISILRRECLNCHGPEKQEGNLRIDSLESLRIGGDNGTALGDVGDSQLLQRVEHTDSVLAMPPKRPLSGPDIFILKEWIKRGAEWPDGETFGDAATTTKTLGNAWSDPANPIRILFDGDRLDLWSLQPIRRPLIPEVNDTDWCRNPIDRLVLSEWEREGRQPAAAASDFVLARRTSLDITGLPPDYAQVQRFVRDATSDKYERWIDGLLSSKEFGVHWARMWLDVVRYSDSNGFDWDEYRPNAWRYRDYVVRAFNRDLSYDKFLEQQLAGDELFEGPPRDSTEQDSLIATGFLRLGPQDNAAALFNEQDRARSELLTDLTETSASAFLGLTMSCCRCHDHKTDPLSQADHYRLRAFFAACEYVNDVSIDLASEQTSIEMHNQRLHAEIQTFEADIEKVLDIVARRQTEKVDKKEARELMNPAEREEVSRIEAKVSELKSVIRPLTVGLLMRDKVDDIPAVHVLQSGDHRLTKQVVEPGFPSVLFPNVPELTKPTREATTGRRLTLARWLASPDNPWTARVIVNRIWQSYFGQGIVATPNDFGVTGAPPSHPELLDYLAIELIESGWSLKHVHRLILCSNVYRQRSVSQEETDSSLPVSLRRQMKRMSAEQLRDSILKVSGLLQDRSGGPPVWPVLDDATLAANPAVLDDNETKTKGWYPSPDSMQSVRSLYLVQKRTIRIPWMETFDLPENVVSCGRRECSIVAPQSLALMNGGLSIQSAEKIAERIGAKMMPSDEEVVRTAFRMVLLRDPNENEADKCVQYLETRTLAELALVLLNTNEFGYIE